MRTWNLGGVGKITPDLGDIAPDLRAGYVTIDDEAGETVCEINIEGDGAPAVAVLIAATPELLKQLKLAEEWLSGMHSDSDGGRVTELRHIHHAQWEAIDAMRAAIAKAERRP